MTERRQTDRQTTAVKRRQRLMARPSILALRHNKSGLIFETRHMLQRMAMMVYFEVAGV